MQIFDCSNLDFKSNRIHSLKYLRSTTSGYKEIGIRKSVSIVFRMSGHIALSLCFLVTALLCIQADTGTYSVFQNHEIVLVRLSHLTTVQQQSKHKQISS